MALRDNEKWNRHFEAYKDYITEHGTFPASTVLYHDLKLGQWFRNQLNAHSAGIMPAERIAAMDAFNPVWRGTNVERKKESIHLMIASGCWKKNLPSDEVPVDQALSGDDLYACLSRGIYTCRDYIDTNEVGAPNTKSMQGKRLFALENRINVFHAQFPKVDFHSFNLYIGLFTKKSPDLFKYEELNGKTPSLFECAATMSANSQFASRANMREAYLEVLNELDVHEMNILYSRFFLGMSGKEIRQTYDIPQNRFLVMERKACRKMRYLIRKHKICPIHPQDALQDQMKQELQHEPSESDCYNNPTSIPINKLNVSRLTVNCLKRAKLYTLGDVSRLTSSELIKIPNLGYKGSFEILSKLVEFGLGLAPNSDEQAPKNRLSLDAQISAASSQKTHSRGETESLDNPNTASKKEPLVR